MVIFVSLISREIMGQCTDPPSITLSSTSSSTCGTGKIIISGNTFGGNTNGVTLTTNGTGTLSPKSSAKQPFDITYTPSVADAGMVIVIKVTTNPSKDQKCTGASESYVLIVDAIPSPPVIGNITQTSCNSATGSVELTGLPSTTNWNLTQFPGGISTIGSGPGTVISGLLPGSYTFNVTTPGGCVSNVTANVIINPQPPVPNPPVAGPAVQPTCTVSTGSVELTGLPGNGNWTVSSSPEGVSASGAGNTVVIPTLSQGTYYFTVTNSYGCASRPSGNVVINSQPVIPAAPIAGAITAPDCSQPTGSVVILGLPSSGTWVLTRYPGSTTLNGAGTTLYLSGLQSGIYNFSVTSSDGCVSKLSQNIQIPSPPDVPAPPVIGRITQPHNGVPSGSVVVNGLPVNGSWTLTLTPGNSKTSGSGSSAIISNLSPGTYNLTVTNSTGCMSASSNDFSIIEPSTAAKVLITNPLPVCYPSTVNLTDAGITAGSTSGLEFTYWLDASATKLYASPATATNGIYYIKGTNSDGFSSIKQVKVSVYPSPVAKAGPDQILPFTLSTSLDANPVAVYEAGLWTVLTGSGIFTDATASNTEVTGLSPGTNLFLWLVTDSVCPAAADTIAVFVREQVIPTLITPNMDGRNDYFILRGSDFPGKIELIIFDRRGVEVFKNSSYDDTWNGVDQNGNPLPDDTYFYLYKTENGSTYNGFIVLRR